jgi:hypothetical protein
MTIRREPSTRLKQQTRPKSLTRRKRRPRFSTIGARTESPMSD